MTPSKKIFVYIKNLIAIIIIIVFFGYLWKNKDQLSNILVAPTELIILSCGLILITWLITSTQSYILFRTLDTKIGFFECLILSLASNFGNHLPFRAGTLIKAHYLKAKHKLDYSRFGSIFGVRLVLILLASGTLGITTTLLFFNNTKSAPLLIVFSLMSTLPLITFFVPPSKNNHKSPIFQMVHRFSDSFHSLLRDPKTSLMCFFLILTQLFLTGFRFQIAAELLAINISIPTATIFVCLSSAAGFIAITPGAIGIRESLMGYASLATGTKFSTGVLIGSADRAVLLILTALFGGVSFIFIWKSFHNQDEHSKHY